MQRMAGFEMADTTHACSSVTLEVMLDIAPFHMYAKDDCPPLLVIGYREVIEQFKSLTGYLVILSHFRIKERSLKKCQWKLCS